MRTLTSTRLGSKARASLKVVGVNGCHLESVFLANGGMSVVRILRLESDARDFVGNNISVALFGGEEDSVALVFLVETSEHFFDELDKECGGCQVVGSPQLRD